MRSLAPRAARLNQSSIAFGLVLLFVVGCSPSGVPDYETEYFRFFSVSGTEICQGTLLRFDETAAEADDTLGRTRNTRFDVYLYDEGSAELEASCGPGRLGCFKHGSQTVHAAWGAVNHELGHAATAFDGSAYQLFEEGMAVDFAGRRTRFGDTTLGSNFDPNVKDLDYTTAGHFMRWLRLTYGMETVLRLTRDVDWTSSPYFARTKVNEIFGVDFEALEREFYNDAPVYLPGFAKPFTGVALSGDLTLDADLDCGSPTTFGDEDFIWVEQDLVVETSGTWQIVAPP